MDIGEAQTKAETIVDSILNNLKRRKGIGNELGQISDDVYEEIIETLQNEVVYILCQK